MQIAIWNIQGKGGFHFGRHGRGQEESHPFLNSDTLFAALVSRLALTRGSEAAEEWGKPFLKDPPPLVITSAFPRIGDLRFYPAPAGKVVSPSAPQDEVPQKSLKKIGFVSESVFKDLLGGKYLAEAYQDGVLLQEGRMLIAQSELGRVPQEMAREGGLVWKVEQRPRVTIDRITQASSLYFTGRTVFAPECGLWFGVRWLANREEMQADLKNMLEDLGDAGLGGERSTGFGGAQFTAEKGAVDLPNAHNRPWVTLSRYLPRRDEIQALQHPASAYTLETVGGWAASPGAAAQRRRPVHMLAEGSVLGPLEREVPGQVVDTQPVYTHNGEEMVPLGHPVWRSGLALAVGFSAGGD